MYIEKADYTGRIDTGLLNLLIAEDEVNILKAANKKAVDTISTKAGVVYDVSGELAKTGADRNGYILGLAISIALYEIYMRSDNEEAPAKVIKNYEDDMEELDKVSRGKSPLQLPAKTFTTTNTEGDDTRTTTGHGLRRFGSLKKKTHTP